MPGLMPPRGTNAPAPQGGLQQDVNQDGTIDEQDVMALEEFLKMLKSIVKKKSSPAAGPQDVLNSPSAIQSAELMDPKFESEMPPFLGQ